MVPTDKHIGCYDVIYAAVPSESVFVTEQKPPRTFDGYRQIVHKLSIVPHTKFMA